MILYDIHRQSNRNRDRHEAGIDTHVHRHRHMLTLLDSILNSSSSYPTCFFSKFWMLSDLIFFEVFFKERFFSSSSLPLSLNSPRRVLHQCCATGHIARCGLTATVTVPRVSKFVAMNPPSTALCTLFVELLHTRKTHK